MAAGIPPLVDRGGGGRTMACVMAVGSPGPDSDPDQADPADLVNHVPGAWWSEDVVSSEGGGLEPLRAVPPPRTESPLRTVPPPRTVSPPRTVPPPRTTPPPRTVQTHDALRRHLGRHAQSDSAVAYRAAPSLQRTFSRRRRESDAVGAAEGSAKRQQQQASGGLRVGGLSGNKRHPSPAVPEAAVREGAPPRRPVADAEADDRPRAAAAGAAARSAIESFVNEVRFG